MTFFTKAGLCLFFLSLSWSNLFAQDRLDDMDSLYQVLDGDISNETRLEAIVDIAERFAFLNLDSALHYINIGEKLLPLVTDSIWIANTYSVAAKIHLYKKDYGSAMSYSRKCLLVSDASGYNMGAEMALDMQGSIMRDLGKFDSAIFYFNQALHYADSIGKAILMNNLGLVYSQTGQVEKGASYYVKSIKLIDKSHPYADYYLTTFYLNLGNLKVDQEETDEAIVYMKLALQAAINTGDKRREALANRNLGVFSTYKKQFDSASYYLHRSLILNRELNNEEAVDGCKLSLADLHLSTKRLDSAEYYLEGLSTTDERFEDLNYQLTYKSVLAGILIHNKKYGQAVELLNELMATAKESDEISKLRNAADLMFQAYEGSADFKNALVWHKKKTILKDSFSNLAYKRHLSDLEEKYDSEKKESEIATLSQQATIQAFEIKQKNTGILIGVALVVMTAGGIYFVNRQRTLKQAQAQMELEQRFLRSQLNPHFISNALLAVQNFMLKKQPEEAAVYLSKFSKLMRETLENSRQEFILLEDELQMLTNFMDIHKMRMNESFDYHIHMADNIDPETDTIPPMFVQPFVENAIEHGITHAKDKGQIDLYFEKEGEYISIVVKDNGGGFAQNHSNQEGHTSLSSTIIRERMAIFNKTLKRKIQLILGDVEGEGGEIQGSKVELKVPFSYI